MSSGRKCKNCGSSEIEVDPARGDAVCTSCGSVLEHNIIVAEVQFEEGAHGTSSAIGQFVSSESKGGATSFGASFHVGMGVESREITLKKAKNGITNLCSQLRLNQHHIDTACGFFRLALTSNLTRGRRNTHVYAACVYLTCRTEGTAHLLIDISDVLQICCFELGRTYLRLSKALNITIPSVDPCLYILRFAGQLEFGPKTQLVANTALRLVQRMKRDSIHSGRRPSGLCGAALLIAARLHEFSRTAADIIKIVKVHESTLKKRLIEFGDTPSSALTLEEFMTVDLEEEQDPPSFKAARKKDKERLQKLMDEEADTITELQRDIELQLERDSKKKKRGTSKFSQEHEDADKFIGESTVSTIAQIIREENVVDDPSGNVEPMKELGPDIASMGLATSIDDTSNVAQSNQDIEVDLSLDDIDDEELDTYIMTEHEYKCKSGLWYKFNAAYLEEQKVKEEKLKKEKEEGKPEKKKRKSVKKKSSVGPANSASEAIERIIQEKKISSKINYEVLRSLTAPMKKETTVANETEASETRQEDSSSDTPTVDRFALPATRTVKSRSKRPKLKKETGLPFVEATPTPVEEETNVTADETYKDIAEGDMDEDYEEDETPVAEETSSEMGVMQLLRQHRENDDEAEEYFGRGYDEEDY